MKRILYITICLISFSVTCYIILFENINIGENSIDVFSENNNTHQVIENQKEEVKFNVNNEITNKIDVNEINSTVTEVNVFKIQFNSIKSILSSEEQQQIKYIFNKLSAIDLAKIRNIEDSSSSEEFKFVEINRILQIRLNSEDYKIYRDILEDYVDFDSLNAI